MPGVYGWDIGGSKAVAAKVEDGGVTVVPNKLTGDRFTPVVVPESPSAGVRQIGVHSAHSQGDLRDVNDVSKMASFMTHLKDNTTSGHDSANCYVLTVPHYFTDAEVRAVLDAFHFEVGDVFETVKKPESSEEGTRSKEEMQKSKIFWTVNNVLLPKLHGTLSGKQKVSCH